MDWFFAAMGILVGYPFLAAGVGAALLVAGKWRRRRGAIAVGVLWLVYALYETGMQQRWLCSGECNIRVDLVLIYPLLLLSLVVAVVGLIRGSGA